MGIFNLKKFSALVILTPFFIGASSVEKTLNSFGELPKIGSPTCTPTPTPEPVAYECKIIPVGDTPEAPKKVKKKADEFTLYQDNDNTMLVMFEYGDDLGYTNGMGATFLKQLDSKNPEKNKSITFDLMSELYTQEKAERPKNGKNYAVNFVDVSRLKATYAQGEKFYFLLGVGVEDRQTKPTKNNNLTPEAQVQEWWHEAFNLDLNQYDPAGDTDSKKFSRTSVLLNAGAGKKVNLYEGRCQLQGGANVSISTEDKTMVGQNSFASVNGGLKSDFLKDKKGDARFSTGMDASVVYFPVGTSDQKKFGATGRVSFAGNMKVGKSKKNTLQPFLTFTLPVGRQIFSPINDQDVIQRIGLRFIFGK